MATSLSNCQRALETIKPLTVEPGLSDLDSIRSSLAQAPTLTLLTADFCQAMMTDPAVQGIAARRGHWLQVGVWRGGGALFLRALMADLGCPGELHLYDTFDRIPVENLQHTRDEAFVAGLQLQDDLKAAPASVPDVMTLLEQQELSDGVFCHAGDIRSDDAAAGPSPVTLLHLDLDFYAPTYAALSRFYDSVSAGGIILFDDYYHDLLGCREAVDDFLAQRGIRLSALERFSGYAARLIKPGSDADE